MPKFALKVGKFLKLLDPDHTLSLTNLSVWVVLGKLAVSKDAISPVDVGALVGTLMSYQGKKIIGKMANKGAEKNVD